MMWIFTPKGFFSVVDKGGPGDTLVIRARVEGDLIALRDEHIPDLKIERDKGTDYRYRATVERRLWLNTLVELGDEITYSNFKNEVKERQGKKRARAYEDVWWILLQLQPRRRLSKAFRRLPLGIGDELPDGDDLAAELEEGLDYAIEGDTGRLSTFD